jgi:hypothetical protein
METEPYSKTDSNPDRRTRTGLHKYFRIYKPVPYVCGIIAAVLFIGAFLELVNITNSSLRGYELLLVGMLLVIISMLSRMYYKMFA